MYGISYPYAKRKKMGLAQPRAQSRNPTFYPFLFPTYRTTRWEKQLDYGIHTYTTRNTVVGLVDGKIVHTASAAAW